MTAGYLNAAQEFYQEIRGQMMDSMFRKRAVEAQPPIVPANLILVREYIATARKSHIRLDGRRSWVWAGGQIKIKSCTRKPTLAFRTKEQWAADRAKAGAAHFVKAV